MIVLNNKKFRNYFTLIKFVFSHRVYSQNFVKVFTINQDFKAYYVYNNALYFCMYESI